MTDYAGAVAAMRARFVAQFPSTVPVVYQNEDPPSQPWPPPRLHHGCISRCCR
jgi:hypothetical protein